MQRAHVAPHAVLLEVGRLDAVVLQAPVGAGVVVGGCAVERLVDPDQVARRTPQVQDGHPLDPETLALGAHERLLLFCAIWEEGVFGLELCYNCVITLLTEWGTML